MEINISWKNIPHSKTIEERINKKMEHIKKFSERISSANFVISHKEKKNLIEVQIKIEKAPLIIAKHSDYDLIKTLDTCINKATREIKKYEAKVKKKKYG